jgi:CBS domain-containing protein
MSAAKSLNRLRYRHDPQPLDRLDSLGRRDDVHRVISVTVDTEVDETRRLPADCRIHPVPVLDGAALAGIVSRSDVVAMPVTLTRSVERRRRCA